MSSKWQIIKAELNSVRCLRCHGSGKCDDSSCGDMSYNEWQCEQCEGTGFAQGDIHTLKQEIS